MQEVSPVQVSVQRLTRAKQRARSGTLLLGCLTRGKKTFFFSFFISSTGTKSCCLGSCALDDNGIIFLRSHQMFPVVDFTVLECV